MARRLTPGVVAAFAAIYLIWGTTYLGIKLAITTLPPLTMMAIRAFTAGGILYAWGRWRGAGPPTAAQWMGGAVVGALLFLGGHGGLAWAEQRVPSGVAALLSATLPLWMAMMQALTDGTAVLTARRLAGLATGTLGVLMLVGPGALLGSEPVDLLGATVLVLTSLAWSLGSAVAQRTPHPASLSMTSGSYLLSGGVLLFAAGLVSGELRDLHPDEISFQSLAALVYLIAFGSVMAFGAYAWLIRRRSLGAVSTHAFVNPVVAVFLGWALGGESLNARVLGAATLVVIAVMLILSGRAAAGDTETQTAPAVMSASPRPLTASLSERRCA